MNSHSKVFYTLLALALLPLFSQNATAQIQTWGGSNGNWNVPANWTSGTVPGGNAIVNSGIVELPVGVTGTAGILAIGDYGAGSMVVSGGLISDFSGTMGGAVGSSGIVSVSSGTWNTSVSGGQGLTVGASGTGTLNITDSGVVTIGNGAGALALGLNSTSDGVLNIGAGGTPGILNAAVVMANFEGAATVNFNNSVTGTFTPEITDYGAGFNSLSVNKMGAGTMILSSTNISAYTYSGTTTIAAGALQFGSGSLTNVNLAGSIVNNGLLIIDTSYRAGVTATLTAISGSGAFQQIGTGSTTFTGTSNFSGGTIIDNGVLTFSMGNDDITPILNQSGTNIIVGNNSGDSGTLLVNTGSVSDVNGYLGMNAGSSGTAAMYGGEWTNSGTFFVGYNGAGTLIVQRAGLSVNGGAGALILASGTSSVGTLNIGTGPMGGAIPSTINAASIIGGSGTATVNFNVGIVPSSFSTPMTGSLSVYNIGNIAPITLSGSNSYTCGTFVKYGTLFVGSGGVLNQSGTDIIAGVSSGDNGTFWVGDMSGAPTSAMVSDNNLYLGLSAGANGIAYINNGTWNNAGGVYVGFSGTGTLYVSSGVMNVGSGTGTITIASGAGSTGTLNFSGGTLNTAMITTGSGTGTLNFQNVSSATFTPQIAGLLNVNQTGTGTTVITGSETFSGTTTLSAGTLIMNGAISNSAAVINAATLTLGNSLVFSGSYSQSATGTLNLSIAGPGSYDAISAGGPAALGGILNESGVAYGSSATPGDSFTLISASLGLSGSFSSINLPALQSGLQWFVAYNPNSLLITVYAQQTIAAGSPFSFTATPPGSGPFTYQWSFNGSSIDGATAVAYSANASTSGIYSVMSTNTAGSTTDYFGVTVTPEVSAIPPKGLLILVLLLCWVGWTGRFVIRG